MASNTLASLMVRIGADVTEFNKGLRGMEGSLKQLRNLAVIDLFNSLNNNPFVQLGKDAVVMAAKFETAFLKIKNLTGVNAKDLATYQNSVKVISNKVGVSALSLAESLYTITSSGAEGSKALEILETAAKGAAVGMGQADEVAKALTATTNSFRASGLTAARAAEILFNTTKYGSLDIKDLTANLSNVTPLAAEMGVSLEQLGAFLATVSLSGTGASEGITQLRAVLDAILAPSEQAKKVLDQIGISSSELRDLAGKDLHAALLKLKDGFKGNSEAMSAFFGRKEAVLGFLSALGSNAGFYDQTLKQLITDTNNFGGATAEALESSEQKWARFTTRTTNGLLEGGIRLINIVDRFLKIYDSLPVLNPFFKKDPVDIVAEINQVTAALNPLFSKLQQAGGLNTIPGAGVSSNSLPYVAPKKPTGPGGTPTDSKFLGFMESINQKAAEVNKTFEQLSSMPDRITGALDRMSRSPAMPGVAAQAKLFVAEINNGSGFVGDLDKAIGSMKPSMDAAGTALSKNFQIAAQNAEHLQQEIVSLGEAFAGLIEEGIEGSLVAVGEQLGNLISGGSFDFKSVLIPLADMLISVGKLAIATGIAVKGIFESLKGHPVAAIVGGIALIALGSYVKAKLSAKRLAKGGTAYSEQLAIIGDNPGARHDPEIVSPISILRKELSKELRSPINKLGGSSFTGTNINISGTLTASGSDLVVILDRNKFVQSRQRGY